MNKNIAKLDWFWRTGASYDSDYQAWLAAGTAAGYTLPPNNVKTAQSNFLIALKAYTSMYAKLVTLRFCHSGSVEMASLNVLNAATEVATFPANKPTFSEGNGMKSNGTNSYMIDSIVANEWAGIESDITTIQYISESSTAFSTTQQSHGFRGNSGTANIFFLTPLWSGTLGVKGGFSTAGTMGFPSTNHRGLYIQSVDSTNAITYKDGSKDTDANTEVAPDIAAPRLICARNQSTAATVNATNFYPFYIALDAVGHLFTDQDAADFRTAFLAYQTAVGLP